MKKKLIFAFLLCFLGTNMFIFAQDQHQNREKRRAEFEKFKEKRVEFITQKMELNTEEAKLFWPLCNELQEKKFELNRQFKKALRELNKAKKEGKTPTEEDYKKIVNLSIETKVKEAQLEKEYTNKFLAVISAEKIFLYQEAEQQFARKMLDTQRGNNKK